jgi:hypothetical protein
MRTFFLSVIIIVLAFSVGFGQEKVDVVYLKNGDVRKGMIIENTPNDYIKIETSDGSIFTIKYADIQKMTRETRPSSSTNEVSKGMMARKHDIGVTGALWLGGEISVGGGRPEKDAGLLLRVFYDEFVMEKLGVGLYTNFSPMSAQGTSTGMTMIEFGGAIKPRFPIAEGKAVLKIGLNIGYRMVSSDLQAMDKIDAMGLNLTVEVQFATSSNLAPFIEMGFLAQPVGGNVDYTVQFPPIIYFGGGVAF